MTHRKQHKPDPRFPLRKPDELPQIHERHRTRWERRRAKETLPPEYSDEVPVPEELQRQIQVRAFHKYRDRIRRGLPEDRVADWLEAEQEVRALWIKHHAHPHGS